MKILGILAAIAALVTASLPVSSAHAQWATVGSPTGNPTYCYGNGCGGQRRAVQPNYRAPYTQQNVHGRQVVIMPQQRQANGYQNGYQYRRSYQYQSSYHWQQRSGGAAVQQARRPNMIKQKYLSDCAANGAPVTQLGGGRMNCHRDPSVVTIID